jgi:hypothetical protein
VFAGKGDSLPIVTASDGKRKIPSRLEEFRIAVPQGKRVRDDRLLHPPLCKRPRVRKPYRRFGIEGGKLREKSDFAYGWNAQTGEYGDLFAQGVIDPAKVVRTPLRDAASVASLLITTEAMIAEKPKKEPAPSMPAGGKDF